MCILGFLFQEADVHLFKKRHKKERCVLPLGVLCFSSFDDMHRLLNKRIQIHLGFFHIFYYKHVYCNFVARSDLNCVAEISKKKF